ncbi:MAG: hypothetical protein IKL73_01135 [Lachnospiraceae bacterium]|nr:hypothetical protein [Lachnospiraceae bacterium]
MADGRFEKVYSQNMGIATGVEILRDKTTGVNYIFNYAGNRGGLTVLLDENGKPVITK